MRLFLELAGSLDYLDKLEIVLNRSDATLGIQAADAERSLGHPIRHTVVSDGATVVYALNRGVPFSISDPDTRVSRDVMRIAERLLSTETAEPAQAAPAGKRRSLLARR
jgi:pilus assembly protein CpaE